MILVSTQRKPVQLKSFPRIAATATTWLALLLLTSQAVAATGAADNAQASKEAPVLSGEVNVSEIQQNGSTPEEFGLAIVREADRRDTGFGNTTVDLNMTLLNADGSEVVRKMRNKILEVENDGDKTLIIFDQPPDLRGTALLTYTHKTDADDQWLYLPALKRAKRISSADKSGPFMGSEFAFEDLTSQEVEKYHYRYLREEHLDGNPHFVIERTPVDKKSGYTRQIVWVDREYRTQKIEYYDRKNALLKTMLLEGYQLYLDQFWRAERTAMTNHQTGKATILEYQNYKFLQGLTELDFTREALSRIR